MSIRQLDQLPRHGPLADRADVFDMKHQYSAVSTSRSDATCPTLLDVSLSVGPSPSSTSNLSAISRVDASISRNSVFENSCPSPADDS